MVKTQGQITESLRRRFWHKKSPGVNFHPVGPKDIRSFTPNSSTASCFVKPPLKKRQRLLKIANEVTRLMNPKTSSTSNSSVSSETRRSRKERSRRIEAETKAAKLKILEDKLKKIENDGALKSRSKPRMRKLKSREWPSSTEVLPEADSYANHGTCDNMEFPHLGEHCSVASCKILDFLPIKCDACSKTFCGDHYSYQSHSCAHRHANDVQVPVCPLCSCPVSGFKRGDPPDIAVSQHLDNMCKNSGKKVYSNRCSARTCKNKEIVPIRCGQCRKNFCLKHRHPTDHECRPDKTASRPASSSASSVRQQDRDSIERQEREDEELARAIQASLIENVPRSRGYQGPGSSSSNPRNPPLYVPPSTVDQPSCSIS